MKGTIINFKTEKGFGFIKGEDNKKYFFHISNVSNPMDIEENYMVDFKGQSKDKGLVATNIKVSTPLASGSKDKILKIKDLRIRASDIKEYNVSKTEKDGSFQDEDGNYHYILTDSPDNYYKYKGIGKADEQEDYYFDYESQEKFTKIANNELMDDMIGLYQVIPHSQNTHTLSLLDRYSSLINLTYYKRNCYTLEIETYTSGEKYVNFISHNGDLNKIEAYKWLDYIDDELEKLI